ncbi:MAG: NHLP bacteriocin system secretion protein [Acidobacteriota bacterium]
MNLQDKLNDDRQPLSHERLAGLLRVTSFPGWVVLIGLGVVIFLAGIWGFVGKIKERVEGPGILIHGGQLESVVHEGAGRVLEILVVEDETVSVGQPIARIAQDEIHRQIESAEEKVRIASSQGGFDRGLIDANLAQKRSQLASAQEELGKLQELRERQLITGAKVRAAEDEMSRIQREINDLQAQAVGSGTGVSEAQRQLRLLVEKRDQGSLVVSDFAGRVVQIKQPAGSIIGPGMAILDVEPFELDLEAVFYVPSKDGKKIVPGMEVLIQPATVKREEFGSIVGEVISVGSFPESQESLLRTLRNQVLAGQLSGSGANFQVKARMYPAETTSGFQWDKGAGPALGVFSGTPIEARITTKTKAPVSMVLPIMRDE